MKIKGKLNKLHRVNSNGVLCDKGSLNKLRSGETIDVTEEVAQELLSMGFVEQIKGKSKKEAK
jgi:hypothetical protein